MSETQILFSCAIVSAVGLSVVVGIIWFGRNLIRIQIENRLFGHPYWEELFHRWLKGSPTYDDLPRYLSEGYSDYL